MTEDVSSLNPVRMKREFWRKIFDAKLSGPLDVAIGLLVLRLGFGGVMLFAHGWGKLTTFSERAPKFSDPIGLGPQLSLALATFAEAVCAGLLIVGLVTRLAALPLVINMSVIVFIVHANDPFRQQELPILFGLAYLALLFMGPGKFSLDALISRKLG